MVIKTELCAFSQWKIYPGHGQRVVDKDGRNSLYLYKRSRVFSIRKIKAQKLRWTTAWRRLNRKTQKDDAGKKKKKRVFKRERAIEGVTLDAIKKMKTAKPEERKALAQEAILEIKERKKGLIEKKRAEKKVNTNAPAAQKPVKVADKGGKKPAVKGKK